MCLLRRSYGFDLRLCFFGAAVALAVALLLCPVRALDFGAPLRVECEGGVLGSVTHGEGCVCVCVAGGSVAGGKLGSGSCMAL
jgi:hypothetical protein